MNGINQLVLVVTCSVAVLGCESAEKKAARLQLEQTTAL